MMLAMAGAVGSFFGQQEKVTKQEARLAQAAEVQAEWSRYADEDAFVVLIDAGHGAQDSGKVGVHGELEKDINLQIANRLYEYLVQEGVAAVRTRPEDDSLYDPGAANQKLTELRARCEAAETSRADIVVSIHQNSFTEEKYRGAQVFYYGPSERSRGLAASIQQALIEFQDPDNTRQEKANEDYYLLRKETVPTVICECGFMSNAAEEALLKSEMYQEKTAWAISVGIVRYLNGSTEKGDIEHDR